MTKKTANDESKVYVIKVTLLGSEPPIWRRIEVLPTASLAMLHHVIQCVMGWEDDHLHCFEAQGRRFAAANPLGEIYDDGEGNEYDVTIGEVLRTKRMKMRYEYDFGDCWQHELVLEDVVAPEPGAQYPRCTAGERACPPEDCGGLWGYYNMLEALSDPEHEDHEHFNEWLGGHFDPDEFNPAKANSALGRLVAKRGKTGKKRSDAEH